jgi:hypothetical protein
VRTTIGDMPTEAPAASAPAAPEQDPGVVMELAKAVLQTVVTDETFIARLAKEVAFQSKLLEPYPMTLGPKEMEGNVLAQPLPVLGQAVLLTMFPVQGSNAHIAAVRYIPAAQADLTGDEATDYMKGSLDVLIYRDHPYDLRKRQIVELGVELEAELYRQLWIIGQRTKMTTGAFFFVTLAQLAPMENPTPEAEQPPAAPTPEGASNGRAG